MLNNIIRNRCITPSSTILKPLHNLARFLLACGDRDCEGFGRGSALARVCWDEASIFLRERYGNLLLIREIVSSNPLPGEGNLGLSKGNARVGFHLLDESLWGVDAIIRPQVIESDVIRSTDKGVKPSSCREEIRYARFVSSPSNLFVNTVTTTVNRPVLSSHDDLDGPFRFDISRKPRDFRNGHDNLELLALTCGAQDAVDKSSSDLVGHGAPCLGVRDAIRKREKIGQ